MIRHFLEKLKSGGNSAGALSKLTQDQRGAQTKNNKKYGVRRFFVGILQILICFRVFTYCILSLILNKGLSANFAYFIFVHLIYLQIRTSLHKRKTSMPDGDDVWDSIEDNTAMLLQQPKSTIGICCGLLRVVEISPLLYF